MLTPYPSGRIVIIARNALGQVSAVTSKQNATAASVNIATGLTWKPMSDLLSGLTHVPAFARMTYGLVTEATFDQDYRLQGLSLRDGPSFISNFTYPYADSLNLTGITDQVTPANSVNLAYSPANSLINADGPWGQKSLSYDGVGNRTSETSVVSGASSVRDLLYSLSSNRVNGVNENGAVLRTYSYDGAGNTATETRPGESFIYGYSNRNRLTTVTRNGVAYASYGYNADEQMTSRSTAAIGGPTGTGIVWNLLNLAIAFYLVFRGRGLRAPKLAVASSL